MGWDLKCGLIENTSQEMDSFIREVAMQVKNVCYFLIMDSQ